MASATTRPAFFFLRHHHHNHHHFSSLKPHHLPLLLLPTPPLSLSLSLSLSSPRLLSTTISSIDVSKEDAPLSPSENNNPSPNTAAAATAAADETADAESESTLDPRRFQEKFAVLNTGIFECRSCGYRYDEAAGDPSYPIPPGFEFAKLPDDWRCPTCGAARSFFESKSVEIAGFAQNQQFGLGGNSLTSGQKALLIYGGLFLGFVFFLSGYFLQ